MRHELIGFAPDVDPATPGVITDCNALIPTSKGMSAANSPVSAMYPPLPSAPRSAFVAELLDGSKRTFVATQNELQEAVAGAWVDRSRDGGYAGTNRTRFTVFGNAVLSTNRAEPIQQSLPGGGFEDIAGSPQALSLVTASGFVLAFNINGMTLGDQPDGWGCSALRNQTDWTPAAATQCVAGRLLDSPGPIRAAAALGGDVVAYKPTSMYLGRYVGPPLVWQWTRVPGDIGCSGSESVVTVGTRHFFVGPDDIYLFDGTVPKPIGAPIREWFFANLSNTNRDKIIGAADLARDLVYWYYPSVNSSNGEIDSCLVYNIKRDRWGKWSVPVQAVVQYSSGQITYDTIGTMFATYDELPNIAYDSPFWISDQTIPGVFIGNTLYSLTGTPGESFALTGDYGDLTDYTFLRRVTPRYLVNPAAATCTNFYRLNVGDAPVPDQTAPLSRGRFDFRRSCRWHRVRIQQTGACTLNGIDIDLQSSGRE